MGARPFRSVALLAFLVLASGAGASVPQNACDRLTAHAEDPGRVAPPVAFKDLDAKKAIRNCELALLGYPTSGRLMNNLGRAFNKAEDYDASLKWTRKAVRDEYPFAYHVLALHYFYGEGVAKDPVEERRYLELAREKGVPLSSQRLAYLDLQDTTRADFDPVKVEAYLMEAGSARDISRLWGHLHFARAQRLVPLGPNDMPLQTNYLPLSPLVDARLRSAKKIEYLHHVKAALAHYEAYLGLKPDEVVEEKEPNLATKKRIQRLRRAQKLVRVRRE